MFRKGKRNVTSGLISIPYFCIFHPSTRTAPCAVVPTKTFTKTIGGKNRPHDLRADISPKTERL